MAGVRTPPMEDTPRLTPRDLTPEGVIKLSFGKKKHVLLRAV